MLANAFDALKTYDWGTDLSALASIEDAVVAAHDNEAVRQELETRLIAAPSCLRAFELSWGHERLKSVEAPHHRPRSGWADPA